ncbi:MAG: hypothetical protein ACRD4M_07665, partial [Candidatus Acidiferrales bacterium]
MPVDSVSQRRGTHFLGKNDAQRAIQFRLVLATQRFRQSLEIGEPGARKCVADSMPKFGARIIIRIGLR